MFLDSKSSCSSSCLVAILVVMLPVYFFSLVLLIKRRDFQPLKSRSVSLIYTSTLGNFIFFLFTMLNLLLSNNIWKMWLGLDLPNKTTGLKVAIWMSCEFTQLSTWLAKPMIYVPYILRALRLLQIWNIHKAELMNEVCDDHNTRKPSTFLINERNLNRILAAFLIPIVLLCFVSSFKTKIELYLPFFSIS